MKSFRSDTRTLFYEIAKVFDKVISLNAVIEFDSDREIKREWLQLLREIRVAGKTYSVLFGSHYNFPVALEIVILTTDLLNVGPTEIMMVGVMFHLDVERIATEMTDKIPWTGNPRQQQHGIFGSKR